MLVDDAFVCFFQMTANRDAYAGGPLLGREEFARSLRSGWLAVSPPFCWPLPSRPSMRSDKQIDNGG